MPPLQFFVKADIVGLKQFCPADQAMERLHHALQLIRAQSKFREFR